jgi:hypothetical protein
MNAHLMAGHENFQRNFLFHFNVICPVQSPRKKYSSSIFQKYMLSSRLSCPAEGRFAIVTDVGMGCGGRDSA